MINNAILLSYITVISFSFCILMITTWYKSQDIKIRLLGYSFFSSLIFNLVSLFLYNSNLSIIFYNITIPFLFLLIILSLNIEAAKNNNVYIFFIIFLPIAAIISIYQFPLIGKYLFQQNFLHYITIAEAGLILIILYKDIDSNRYLLLSISALLASYIVLHYFTDNNSSLWTAPFLELAAYIAFLRFFYQVLLQKKFDKVKEAEKQLFDLDRTIEMEVKKRTIEVEKINKRLLDISKMDSLTQVMNKIAIIDSIEMLIYRYPKSIFSIFIFDIDDFKNINDTFGHIVGDKSIKHLANIGKTSIRDFDMIGRYGGDEFIIILPDTEARHAFIVAERFRKRVETNVSPNFTISIGIASYPHDGKDAKTLIEAADVELYSAKTKGKNTSSYRVL